MKVIFSEECEYNIESFSARIVANGPASDSTQLSIFIKDELDIQRIANSIKNNFTGNLVIETNAHNYEYNNYSFEGVELFVNPNDTNVCASFVSN